MEIIVDFCMENPPLYWKSLGILAKKEDVMDSH